jgi:hypothetical protein
MDRKLGIIVPYRDRYEQLIQFKTHIIEYLKDKNIKYELIIVEQDDSEIFNRGKLLNVGFKYAKRLKCDYVVFHDIDMLPVDVDYSWSDVPIHMATNFIPDNTRTIFDEYFGGVTMFPTISFDEINGYSNEYWGWGFEDDDLLYRCKLHQIPLNTLAIPQPGGQTSALKFNGVNSYVEGVFDFNRYDEITIFVSFCPETMVLNTESYDDKFTIFANSNLRLTYNSYSRYNFELIDANGEYYYINTEIKPAYKTNISVVINKHQRRIKMYQDGNLISSERYIPNFEYENSTFYLGSNGDKDYFRGIINEFAIWDSELTPSEIQTISSNQFFGLTSNFEKYSSEYSLKLYYNPNVIKEYKLVELAKCKKLAPIHNCEIVGFTFDSVKYKQIPHRRASVFKLLEHEENGYVGNGWKEITTRYNQLRFHNEIVTGYKDTMKDGLLNCKYTEHSHSKANNQTHVVVGI